MAAVLAAFEPFALDLWAHPIESWLPPDIPVKRIEKRTAFGGLYQLVQITA